jgi:hypothetical protein
MLICEGGTIPDCTVGTINRPAQVESLAYRVPPACLPSEILNKLKTIGGLLNIGLSGRRVIIHVSFLLFCESRGLWGVLLR